MTQNRDAVDYYNRGHEYGSKGKFDRAIEEFTKAIEIDPKFANAYLYRGIAYYRKREYDRAIKDFTEAININDANNHKDATAYHYYPTRP